MNRRARNLALVALLLVGLPLFFFIFFKSRVPPTPPALRKYWPAPYYNLKAQTGGSVSSDDLKGFVYVADFFFTHCNSVCPKLSELMSKLQEGYKDQPRIRLVSFTIDPDRDSVPALKTYANHYHADPEKWYFLTGDARIIRDTIAEKGFKVPVVPDNKEDGQYTHTDRFVLVDSRGNVRGFYNVLDAAQVDSLYNGIERLLVEK